MGKKLQKTNRLNALLALAMLLIMPGMGWGQIISQYVETNSGSTPKGIEIWNNTSGTLNFGTNNLVIQQGTNGAALSTIVTISTGTLASHEVLVIGTSDIGTYLSGQGLTSVPFTTFSFTFNGDDALAIKYGATTTDIFGTPGSDPGTEWSVNGVSTANQNIALLSGITSGAAAWTDPSLRFATISTTPATLPAGLSGFGIAPVIPSLPTILVSPSTLSSFSYAQGSGPSAEHSFTVSGSNLTSDITITPPSDYEISTGTGGSFSATNPITLTQSGGAVASTTIYVRLKAGLSPGSYNAENITASSTGATSQTVACSGSVIDQIEWCNLQWPFSGTITTGDTYTVYGQVYAVGITEPAGQGAGIQAWVGYSTSNSDPSTWTDWVAATYNGDAGNNDEYQANLGGAIVTSGTYYYAYRYQLGTAPYKYGGSGGVWNNDNGTLTVNAPTAQLDWCNLQWPDAGTLTIGGGSYNVYARVYEAGLTPNAGQAAGIQAWIGYSTENTDPSTWTNWVVATYNTDVTNNDEYVANLGSAITTPGTYYYASRFKLNNADYVYGGYSGGGGNFWDGTNYVSGTLTVSYPPVIINEVDADTPDTDAAEFIELFDGGAGNTPLDGMVVVLFNGNGDVSYAAYDLDGYLTDANGYFLLGNAAVTGVDITFANNFLQQGADAVALFYDDAVTFPNGTAVTTSNLMDAIVYDNDNADDPGLLVLLNPGEPQVNENAIGNRQYNSSQRIPNGSGGARNTSTYLQTMPTPKAENTGAGVISWLGTTNTSWTEPTNWSPVYLPDRSVEAVIYSTPNQPVISTSTLGINNLSLDPSATLTINGGGSLTVEGNTVTNNGLILNDGGSLITNGTITGTATVNKTINDADYHLFTLPVNSTIVASPTFDGYFVDAYNEPAGDWARLTNSDNVSPMKGYSVKYSSGSGNLSFTGSLFTDDQYFGGLTSTTGDVNHIGFNLVGNNFPSAVSLDLAAFPNANLNGYAYVWDGTQYVSGPLAGGVGTLANNVIPAFQGFFVKVNPAKVPGYYVTVPQAARVHSAQPFYKKGNSYENVLGLAVNGNNVKDQMLFVIRPEATNGFDEAYDAYKLFGNADAPQMYTVVDGRNTSISSVPSVESTTEWPVLFKAGVNGSYTLTASGLETFAVDHSVYLEDNLTGLRQDLRLNPEYQFTASPSDDSNRFKLSFNTVGIDGKPASTIGIYAVGNEIRLKLLQMVNGTVSLIGITGQTLLERAFSASGEYSFRANVAPGIYMVKVNTGKEFVTRKVIIK